MALCFTFVQEKEILDADMSFWCLFCFPFRYNWSAYLHNMELSLYVLLWICLFAFVCLPCFGLFICSFVHLFRFFF